MKTMKMAVGQVPDRKQAAGSAMNAFLAGISQENRVIFLRRYWFCDTIQEIAERYGIRERRVKKCLSQTCAQLAEFLAVEGAAV